MLWSRHKASSTAFPWKPSRWQKIEHVIEPLRTIKSESEEMLRRLEDPYAGFCGEKSQGGMSWLEDMYTMESERQVMKKTLSQDNTKAVQTAF